MKLVSTHIGSGKLVAGPDAPEVYFLAGRFSQSGSLFDFFADQPVTDSGLSDISGLAGASVVVLNHNQLFSIGLSEDLTTKVRQMFPNSERAGALEVRWR